MVIRPMVAIDIKVWAQVVDQPTGQHALTSSMDVNCVLFKVSL